MEIRKNNGEYVSPEVEVINLIAENVICASADNPFANDTEIEL